MEIKVMSTKDKYKQFVNTAFLAAVEPVVIEKAEGANYFDERKQELVQKQLIRRLEKLGLKVTVEPIVEAA